MVKVGDRVVWLSDNGAEFGCVRWIGHVMDGDSILAGVAFVSSIIPCILNANADYLSLRSAQITRQREISAGMLKEIMSARCERESFALRGGLDIWQRLPELMQPVFYPPQENNKGHCHPSPPLLL